MEEGCNFLKLNVSLRYFDKYLDKTCFAKYLKIIQEYSGSSI